MAAADATGASKPNAANRLVEISERETCEADIPPHTDKMSLSLHTHGLIAW